MFNKQHQQLLSKYKQENKQTKYEELVEFLLIKQNYKYIKQKGFLANAPCCFIADFYLPKPYQIVIEIDGEYHNDRVEYDKRRDTYFLNRGIKTLRIPNQSVLNLSAEDLTEMIETL